MGAPVAYAVNVTVVHLPGFRRDMRLGRIPQDAHALLARRASGDGTIGSWGGVTGYIDTLRDPNPNPLLRVRDADFDPLAYTIRQELEEECGFTSKVLDRLAYYPGERFAIKRGADTVIHIMPVLGIYGGPTRPRVRLNLAELSAYRWVAISGISSFPGIGNGYLKNTLPRALSALR